MSNMQYNPMKHICLLFCFFGVLGILCGASEEEFIVAAKEKHGDHGAEAARFLYANMPDQDRSELALAFLIENLDLALRSRSEFPWGKQIPDDIFLNHVLPYAVFDEKRDPWRAQFFVLAKKIVAGCTTATEATQALNREIFNLINVHYNTGRKIPNQSAQQSMALGKATCTGLSIILVNACRSVGIPARAVGTPLWANDRGNHTWVEIWDGEWKFTGADEYDKNGLNRGWFVNDARLAHNRAPQYAIYATTWKRDGLSFPLVWDPDSKQVSAINVTDRYADPQAAQQATVQLGIRLFDKSGGERLPAHIEIINTQGQMCGKVQTKSGTSDLNDMPRFEVPEKFQGTLRVRYGDEVRLHTFGPLDGAHPTLDLLWSELSSETTANTNSSAISAIKAWLDLPVDKRPADAPALQMPLTKDEAQTVKDMLLHDRRQSLLKQRQAEVTEKEILIGDKKLRWLEKTFGNAKEGERSLWISMHGGGGAPTAVNDQQWQNQIKLYSPEEGIYIAPRAPVDAWNMWHIKELDGLFDRLIEDFIAVRGVNPNKIYLMGYSAGGDGVWKLAPRMADRFAAASMMAGHPNGAPLLPLRNLPFGIFMGGNDAAYKRNEIATERAAEMKKLAEADPGSYVHIARIYPGLPHWMNRKDAESVPWMAQYTRQPWPKKIIWIQDNCMHQRFYWLQIPDMSAAKDGQKITATVKDNSITLEGDMPKELSLALSDELINLEAPIAVTVADQPQQTFTVTRTAAAMVRSLNGRLGAAIASAWIDLK